jgi:hypothetical protein
MLYWRSLTLQTLTGRWSGSTTSTASRLQIISNCKKLRLPKPHCLPRTEMRQKYQAYLTPKLLQRLARLPRLSKALLLRLQKSWEAALPCRQSLLVQQHYLRPHAHSSLRRHRMTKRKRLLLLYHGGLHHSLCLLPMRSTPRLMTMNLQAFYHRLHTTEFCRRV